MTYFGIFDQKSIIWVFLRKNFKNAIVIFEISTPKFASFRNFKNKQKCLNFAPKMPYWVFLTKNTVFRYLWIRIKKKLLSYLKSAPSNLSNYKISRFRTKNALLRYFLTISWKNYCHIWNEHLRICLISKFCKETKMPKFGTKNAIFCYFWLKMHYLSIFGQEF